MSCIIFRLRATGNCCDVTGLDGPWADLWHNLTHSTQRVSLAKPAGSLPQGTHTHAPASKHPLSPIHPPGARFSSSSSLLVVPPPGPPANARLPVSGPALSHCHTPPPHRNPGGPSLKLFFISLSIPPSLHLSRFQSDSFDISDSLKPASASQCCIILLHLSGLFCSHCLRDGRYWLDSQSSLSPSPSVVAALVCCPIHVPQHQSMSHWLICSCLSSSREYRSSILGSIVSQTALRPQNISLLVNQLSTPKSALLSLLFLPLRIAIELASAQHVRPIGNQGCQTGRP